MITLILSCIILVYLLLIGSFAYGFEKIKWFKLLDLPSKTRFSIIIPFRNEAEHVLKLLESIESLLYPTHLFEIIFVDDASEDDSAELIMRFLANTRHDIKVISNERKTNSPKKDAITKAISHAKNEWIITTDADCVLPKYWLDSYDEFIQQTQPICIAAPVTYTLTSSFLNKFQILDFLSLQGATIGSFGLRHPFLCNGANFAYKKEMFNTLNGFDGNHSIASGDDIFLLEKMLKFNPKKVRFLKCENAIVTTSTQPTWHALIAQRKRWAAKTSAYNNVFGKLTGLIVLLTNVTIVIGYVLSVLGLIKVSVLFYILFIKFNIDVLLIYKAASFYNQKEVLKSVFFGFLVYPFFSVYIAFLSVFTNYTWKGRSFKK